MFSVPSERFIRGIHYGQNEVLEAFDAGQARFFMLNWHRRARKTTLAINLMIREAYKHERSVYVYVAPTYKQGKAIIWRDPNMLFSYLPPRSDLKWERNESELFVEFPNKSVIQIKGADDPDSLRGIDARGVVFDEWALMKELIWSEIFLPIIRKDQSKWAMFIFTPKGTNHAYTMWNRYASDLHPDWFLSFLDGETSGLYPADELSAARLEMPTSLYDQEIRCSFITDEDRVLITSRMLENLKANVVFEDTDRVFISCDPSLGGDECVAYAFRETEIIDELFIRGERDPGKICNHLVAFGIKNGTDEYVVDGINVGASICALLSDQGKIVHTYVNSEKADEPERFENRRAEAAWNAYEMCLSGNVAYPDDEELRRQITAQTYTSSSKGRFKLDDKESIRQRIGRSPDRYDAWVMGLDTLKRLEVMTPEEKRDIDRTTRSFVQLGPMAV